MADLKLRIRRRLKAAHRTFRELKMIAKGLLSTGHPIQVHIIPMRRCNLACAYCNSAKGSNVAGYDPVSGELTPLYNPRSNSWHEHFAWNGPVLRGLTPVGRTTVDVLRINDAERIQHRSLLMGAGLWPVED